MTARWLPCWRSRLRICSRPTAGSTTTTGARSAPTPSSAPTASCCREWSRRCSSRSGDGDAGACHLVECLITVAGLQVDGAHGIADDRRVEAEPHRVERRLLHAVVGRETDDDDAFGAMITKQRLELRRCLLAGDRVAHREA